MTVHPVPASVTFPPNPNQGDTVMGSDGALWRWDGVRWTFAGWGGEPTIVGVPEAPDDGQQYARQAVSPGIGPSWTVVNIPTVDLSAYATQAWVTNQLSPYATQSWVTTQLAGATGGLVTAAYVQQQIDIGLATITEQSLGGPFVKTSYLPFPIAITQGGTGAATAPLAVSNLGALALAGGTMTGDLNMDANLHILTNRQLIVEGMLRVPALQSAPGNEMGGSTSPGALQPLLQLFKPTGSGAARCLTIENFSTGDSIFIHSGGNPRFVVGPDGPTTIYRPDSSSALTLSVSGQTSANLAALDISSTNTAPGGAGANYIQLRNGSTNHFVFRNDGSSTQNGITLPVVNGNAGTGLGITGSRNGANTAAASIITLTNTGAAVGYGQSPIHIVQNGTGYSAGMFVEANTGVGISTFIPNNGTQIANEVRSVEPTANPMAFIVTRQEGSPPANATKFAVTADGRVTFNNTVTMNATAVASFKAALGIA